MGSEIFGHAADADDRSFSARPRDEQLQYLRDTDPLDRLTPAELMRYVAEALEVRSETQRQALSPRRAHLRLVK